MRVVELWQVRPHEGAEWIDLSHGPELRLDDVPKGWEYRHVVTVYRTQVEDETEHRLTPAQEASRAAWWGEKA